MPQPFIDQRFANAAQRLRQGDVRLLSLDVFDTLIIRRVPAPSDVFLRMGTILRERGFLLNGQTPESFAAIRYQNEYAARNLRQKTLYDREVTLADIYRLFPPHITPLSKAALAALETETERELTFINPDGVALMHAAQALNIPIALVSNMYIGEAELRPWVQGLAPTRPEVSAWFVSSDHRMGKRTGLLRKMAAHFGLAPAQILHVGDNPVSDRLAAEEASLHFASTENASDMEERLSDEHPRQWRDRAACFGTAFGDGGMTWLRRRASFEASGNDPHALYGKRMMGPLLTGFAFWAAARAQQEKAGTLFGLLREGALLGELAALAPLSPPAVPIQTLAASRMSVALASFSPEHPDYLEDFLTRRGFWTLDMLMKQLGFDTTQAAQIGDPKATLETITPLELTQKLLRSSLSEALFAQSKARRKRLITYLKRIGALAKPRLYLLDLGYAATIQRGLQRVFTIENVPITTHGFYMAAAHVSRLTQESGGIVEGFLAQNGNPNDFACAFCRAPEIVELACMPPYGSVIDYDQAGDPLFTPDTAPEQQQREVAAMQRGIHAFAHDFAALVIQTNLRPDFTSDSWRAQMRDIALRIVGKPTAEEAALMGHWLADSDMGLASPRPIVSAGPHQEQLSTLDAPALATLPRRDVPWLYGVAATQSPALARQVLQIIMRREKPDVFGKV